MISLAQPRIPLQAARLIALTAGLVLVIGAAAPVAAQTTPNAAGGIVIGRNDNGKSFHVDVGQTVTVRLGDTLNWTVDIEPAGVLVPSPLTPPLPRGTQGVWVAADPGVATVSATGSPICPLNQPCPALVQSVRATVVVGNDGGWQERIEGKPRSFEAGSTGGYYFWHDEDGLHVWTTDPENVESHFKGTLTTDGIFQNLSLQQAERDDSASIDGTEALTFDLHTFSGVDGFNFTIDGGTYVRLELKRDGNLISVDNIFLGAYSVHPDHNPMEAKRR